MKNSDLLHIVSDDEPASLELVETKDDYNYFSNIDYLMLETNSSCNLRCPTCNRELLKAEGRRPPKDLTVDDLRFILDKLTKCKIDTIKFEGLSEPMLHPDFDMLSEVLRSYFPNAFVIIATNLQYEVLKTPFLRTLPFVDMVYLSIDGIYETYERARLGGKYSKLLKTLDTMKEHITEEVRRKKLFINFTLTPENYLELPHIYELRDRYQLSAVRINLAQNWNEEENNDYDFNDEIITFLQPYRQDVKGIAGWEYRDCYWPFNGIIIDVYGDVRQCVINTSMTPLCNIFSSNIEDIYNRSAHFVETRRKLQSNQAAKNCEHCDYHHLSPILEKIFGGKYLVNQLRSNMPKVLE